MLSLTLETGPDAGRVFAQEDAAAPDGLLFRLGRDEAAHIVLQDSRISTHHVEVHIGDGGYLLRDLGSTNGTRLERGSETFEVRGETALRNGDVILVGAFVAPTRLRVTIREEETNPQVVSVRDLAELKRADLGLAGDFSIRTLNALTLEEILPRVYQAQKEIGATLELDELVDVAAKHVFLFLPRATHFTVALREDGDDGDVRYVPIGTRVKGDPNATKVPVTRSVIRKVVRDRSAILAADAAKEVGETASMMSAQVRSTIGIPLWQGEEIIGVIQVDNRDKPSMFGEQDLDVLALLAQSASQAFSHARLYQRLRVSEEKQRKENTFLKQREESRREHVIVGEAKVMQVMFEQLRKVVHTRITVLVEGETGVGKELVAGAVHYWSNRKDRLFIAQNCAALPENLLESELFGHRKGAFTGATDDKKGLFELADGGTLFLDELGEMPLSLQAKLLRVLQEGEVRPVGSNKNIKVDTRIVAATNRDLEREVAEGRFREDLYYRLRVFPILVPPLRERKDDIPMLANHFLRKYSTDFGKSVAGFSQQSMEMLQSYAWPGNVRELANEMQRVVIQVDDGDFVEPQHVSGKIRQAENVLEKVRPEKGTLREMIDQVERWVLLEALKENNNNKSQTAKILGITREGLHKKLKSLGIG